MKKLLLLAMVLGLLVAVSALAFQNEPASFRGIEWGANITELGDMGLIESEGNTRDYVKKNDKMKIGDADIERIAYGFYKGRFFSVMIAFKGYINYSQIKETLFQLYGSPEKPNQFMGDYRWLGSDVWITLEYKEILDKGIIWYFFKPIVEQKRADKKESSEKGNGDL
jgi:hypothetical protein